MIVRPMSPIWAVLGCLLTASPTTAQTMEFGCPAPGTVLSFDSGIKVIARGQDDLDCRMEIEGGAAFKSRGLLFANPGPDGSDLTAFVAALKPERLWPLEVGKRIEARYSTPKGSWNYVLSVVDYKKRNGPRDALIDTFLIEMNEQGANGQRAVSRWWVSPAEKYAIRFDYSDSSGGANRAIVTDIKRP